MLLGMSVTCYLIILADW